MSSIQGMPSSKRISNRKHVTVSEIAGDKVGLDVLPKSFYKVALVRTIEAGSDKNIINLTAHGAVVGDIIRFVTGLNSGIEATILKIIDPNSFKLGSDLPNTPTITDTFNLMRALSPTVDASGGMITTARQSFLRDTIDTNVSEDTAIPANTLALPSKLYFKKDGAMVELTRDTVTPSNNAAMPVEIVGAGGTTISITAGNINVQLSHLGATADSTRIGDGVNEMGVNASLEALTHDAGVLTAVSSLLTELQLKANLTDTQPVSAVSLPLPTGAATEATLSAADTKLGLLAKLTDTQPVSMASSPLPTGAATETTLAAVQSAIALLAKLTDTQPVSAASLPLPTGAATETTLAAADTKLGLLAKLTDTQPVSAASLPLPTGAATETTLAAQSAKLPSTLGQGLMAGSLSVTMASDQAPIKQKNLSPVFLNTTPLIDTAVTPIPTATFLQVIASTPGAASKIHIVEDIGQYMGLYIGAIGSEILQMVLPLGGGIVEIDLPAGTRVSLKSLTGANIISGSIAMNYLN